MRINNKSKRKERTRRCKCYWGDDFLGTRKDFLKRFGIKRCGNPGSELWERGAVDLPADAKLPMEAEVVGKKVKVCPEHMKEIKKQYHFYRVDKEKAMSSETDLGGDKDIGTKDFRNTSEG